jgi:Transposase DNA-binding
MSDAIADELAGINLGDERLNKRSKHLLEAFAANPEASINAACDGWGDTVAAYRFFDNKAVSPEEIIRPHREATIQRMACRLYTSRAANTEQDNTTNATPGIAESCVDGSSAAHKPQLLIPEEVMTCV